LAQSGDDRGPQGRPQIEQRINELDLRKIVRITGWISSTEVREELLASRALVLPSFAEGLPVVIIEARAVGRPVITTIIAGIPELVEDQRNGWLVPAGDVGRLAESMRAALECETGVLDDMGAHGRIQVRALHDINREAKRLLEHICESQGEQT
jgi:glycosyltransferase involved in cell wall biosynthesis